MKIANIIFIIMALVFMICFSLFLYNSEKHSNPPAVKSQKLGHNK